MLDKQHFKLRSLSPDDVDTVRHWRNQDHVKAYMFTDNEISTDEHSRWFTTALQHNDNDYLIVEYYDQPIGLANAVKIDPVTRSCHWGFYLGEASVPKGCGTALASLMLKHIFDTHSVDTIYAEVFEFNIASLKLHKKFGFTENSQLSRIVTKNNKQEKVIAFSLVRDTFKPVLLED